MALKIKAEHYEKLEAGMRSVLAIHPEAVKQYQDAGLSNMRLNWDVLNAACIEGERGITWVCQNLYAYMNDENIGSALAKIMGNDGMNTSGKRR